MSAELKLPLSVEARNIPIADTGDFEGVVEIKDVTGRVIFSNHNDDEAEGWGFRIKTCVNACAGVDTDDLYTTVAAGQHALHADLLDAAKEALDFLERHTEGLVIDAKDSLRLAIAAAEAVK
jgi:hypothetical protein